MLLHHLKHNQVLHETVILLTVTTEETPRVTDADRVVGIAAQLRGAVDQESRTTYYLGRLSVVPPSERRTGRMPRWRVSVFGFLERNERSATMYFEIPPSRVVELGTRVEL